MSICTLNLWILRFAQYDKHYGQNYQLNASLYFKACGRFCRLGKPRIYTRLADERLICFGSCYLLGCYQPYEAT